MALIGMGEAGKRMGITPNSARRALEKGGVPLYRISDRAFAVEETDLEEFKKRKPGRGRPRKKQEPEG